MPESSPIQSKPVLGDEPTPGMIFRLRKAMPAPAKKAFQFGKAALQLATATLYDARRFARYSGVFDRDGHPSAAKANITKYYHMIEKGLTLPSPRPGFGRQAIEDLCLKVRKAVDRGIHSNEIIYAIDAIAGYQAFNEERGVANPPWIAETLAFASAKGLKCSGAPIKRPDPMVEVDSETLLRFMTSRHSVRHFSDAPVPDEVLTAAARAAQAAPCVCNRQASRVTFARDPQIRSKLLSCQNGNRGFGDTAPIVALITTDLRSFMEPSERYQAWIDGGLFAENLLLAFHAMGYGACPLNWSAMPGQDRQLRALDIVPESEQVIMMVAIGAPHEQSRVARSQRYDVRDVMRLL